jgi:predicted nucleic acid-binding protein
VNGLTLDTGALIALEKGRRRMVALVDAAHALGLSITIPAPVVVEWWRGQRGPVAHLLDAFTVEPLRESLARSAGVALAALSGRPSPSPTDAVVMASAALRGDKVYTSDVEDLQRFRAIFPAVRIFRV